MDRTVTQMLTFIAENDSCGSAIPCRGSSFALIAPLTRQVLEASGTAWPLCQCKQFSLSSIASCRPRWGR